MEKNLPASEGTAKQTGKSGKPASQRWRYLKYAFGEIALVVIGILIALQINNWNEWRKDRAEEQLILMGLKEEFEVNLNGLGYQLNRSKDLLSGMMLFMSHIAEPDSQYSVTELDNGLFSSLFAGTWDPANSALDALLFSGRLQIIVDSELQSKLASWSSIVDEVRDNQITIRDHSASSLWSRLAELGAPNVRGWGTAVPELYQILNVETSKGRYLDIRGNLEFVDLIALKYNWTKHSVEEIDYANQEVKEIIRLITKELKETK